MEMRVAAPVITGLWGRVDAWCDVRRGIQAGKFRCADLSCYLSAYLGAWARVLTVSAKRDIRVSL